MPFIQIIEPEEAHGNLKDIYNAILKSRGKIAEIHKIQSLHPESITAHMGLYMSIMFGRSPLRRVQREMMAVVVSSANKCDYCIRHHGAALMHFWKDAARVRVLSQDYTGAGLPAADLALCEFAEVLTRNPQRTNAEKTARHLLKKHFNDRGILDAALTVSYFNFVNRMALSLGVGLEADPSGYKYE
ncbi:MAG: peroxidase-related enzyme [Bacteroidales bacterium]